MQIRNTIKKNSAENFTTMQLCSIPVVFQDFQEFLASIGILFSPDRYQLTMISHA